MAKIKRPSPIKYYTSLVNQIKTNKIAFAVYVVLRLAVILVMIRCIMNKQYESLFTASLCLVLFLIPPFVEKNFKIELPTVLETLAFIFIFCAEIFGEIGGFYEKYSFWDTMLHTTNGFIFAAFGFCLIDILNQNPKVKFQVSPIYVALTAFCFSMTIGALWEFYEFAVDQILLTDMQKDTIINAFMSVTPPVSHEVITDISKTTIEYAGGKTLVIENGYLDIGVIDTIKDMFVNLIGAVVFSIIGYFYIKRRGKGKIASQFIPVLIDKEETSEMPPETESSEQNMSNETEDNAKNVSDDSAKETDKEITLTE